MALVQTVHLSMANFKSAPVVPAVQNDTDRQVKMIVDDFDLTSGMTGKIAFQRSDSTHYETSATLNTSDNSFTADIDQALTQPGRTMVQLKVTDTLTVSTFSFVIFVEQDNSGTVTPQEGIDLVSAVQAAEDAADRAEAAAETLELDATLTSPTKAAQAKAVGDEIGELKTQTDNLPNEITSALYAGYLFDNLHWENGWVNSAGNYISDSQRHLTQAFSSENGQRVVNNSESTIYIVYFTTFSSLSSFEYDSYSAVDSGSYLDVNTTKPYFLIESLSETIEGLSGVELRIPSAVDYLSNENIQKINKEKKQNATAYVSGNAISWYNYSDGTCHLTINGNIVIRTNYGTTSDNIIAQISVSDLLNTVESAGYTVTGGVIIGTSFAIVFDFDDNTLKALSPTNKEIFDNTVILFAHHYISWTGGELVSNANYYNIETIKNSIQELDSKVEEISPTLPSFLESETSACFNELVDTCDEKTMVIAFTTDNHYGASNGMNFPTTANSIKSINDKFPIDFVVDGGDLINGDKTKTEDITNLSSAVRMLLNSGKAAYTLIGNHDDGSFTSTELPLLSKGELYALLERHSGINLDYIDTEEHYGYKDFDEYNIRVIFLDSVFGTNGHLANQWGYSDAELAWFATNALNTNKQVVMFSHMAFTASFMAYGTNIKNGAEMRGAVESFIANGGVVVALFHGHNHWDYIGQYSQTNGFKEVSTGCGRIVSVPDIPYAHPEGAIMPEREAGTVTQELWDIITIKPMAREVKMIRYGAGDNRTFIY